MYVRLCLFLSFPFPNLPFPFLLSITQVDDISAIFDVTERPYYPGAVSWGNGAGSYFIHRVDREGYAEIRQRFEITTRGKKNTAVRPVAKTKRVPSRNTDGSDRFRK